jgi:hypothetical protein
VKTSLPIKQQRFARLYAGLTLIELVMALGLGVAMSAAITQQYLAMTQLQELQGRLQRTHENSAYARHLISDAIRRASVLRCAGNNTAGLRGWVQIWRPGDPDSGVAIDALPGSDVVSLLDGDCPSPLQSIYFLAHRGRNPENPPALFVRRQRPDGSFSAAEELVEGISRFTIQFFAAGLSESNELQIYIVESDIGSYEFFDPILVGVELEMMTGDDDFTVSDERRAHFHVAGRQYSPWH